MKLQIGFFLLLLGISSCGTGGDVQRRYVISQASDESAYEQEIDFEED